MARVSVPLSQTETLYVERCVDNQTGRRECAVMQVAKSVVATLDWTEGVDGTPWKQPCLVARSGDTVYYRYPAPTAE